MPFREDDLWDGYPEETNAPYGVAKKAVLVGAQAYREQYGLNAVYLLPANLYGPRDNFDLESSHVIPALIRKMLELEGRGRALGRRLADAASSSTSTTASRGSLLAAERYDGAEPVNLGTGVETSIRELAETIADVTGFEGEIVWDTSMPNGQPRRSLDASRAAELFGFRARHAAARGLERTVAWYRSPHRRMRPAERLARGCLERPRRPRAPARSSLPVATDAGRSAGSVRRLHRTRRAVDGDCRSNVRSVPRSPLAHRRRWRLSRSRAQRRPGRSPSAPGRSSVWVRCCRWLVARCFTLADTYDATTARPTCCRSSSG